MNKSFALAGAFALASPLSTSALAQTVLVEQSPKNLKYVGIETSLKFRQVNIVENTRDALFQPITERTAKFIDTKTGEQGVMGCEEIQSNMVINIHTKGPKKFGKMLKQASKDLGCPTGPLI